MNRRFSTLLSGLNLEFPIESTCDLMMKEEYGPDVPADHPRAKSLHYRHQLVEGMHEKVVTPSGLCAHGRGEAFDYLLGEITIPPAQRAMEAAVALLMSAQHPVISVNGNVAALVPEALVAFAQELHIPLEINVFYQAPGRIEAIERRLTQAGADPSKILGRGDQPSENIHALSSNRRVVDPRGIFLADVVMVPLEDGDRTEALVQGGKQVIAVDLNPLSRTAKHAQITIVDNIVRVFPYMLKVAKRLKTEQPEKIKEIITSFDQSNNLRSSLEYILTYLRTQLS